jgi:hypothetical protein
VYFPEPELPFYRVTVFSNYSAHNVANPGRQWALMAEVSEARVAAGVSRDSVVRGTLDGLRAAGLIPSHAAVTSVWHRRIEHGYPTPVVGRDVVLDEIEGLLSERHILSRGRFGAWKYEVGNMDHSFMQGVEAVDRILLGRPETTVRFPDRVNSRPR